MEGIVMTKGLSRCTVVIIVVGILTAFPRAGQQPDSAKACAPLVGTWKIASGVYGGEERKSTPGRTTLKHVTPTQFAWLTYGTDGIVTRAAGGGYTVKGATYEETPEYGFSSDFDVVKGKAQAFACRIEGNKWYIKGSLSNGLTIEEVWERVEAK
jgi:hypothetical protein